MTKINLGDHLAASRAALSCMAEQPLLEAQALLQHVTNQPKVWLMTHPEAELPPNQQAHLAELVRRRVSGEPLPYILGRWEFYGLEFEVTPAVLIPRPESELLVETALAWLATHPGPNCALDVGTGSGCIAITLAKKSRDLAICAVDISAAALRVAQRNGSRLGVLPQVHYVQADLLSAFSNPFALICANLPYIPSQTLQTLPIRFSEPMVALDGGPDGLRLLETLLQQATTRLRPGGRLLLEIEASQGVSAPTLARRYFPQARVTLQTDLAGLPRVVVIDT